MIKYDHVNPVALRKLVAGGSELSVFPVPVLEACMNAANELYAETAAKNAKLAKVVVESLSQRASIVVPLR